MSSRSSQRADAPVVDDLREAVDELRAVADTLTKAVLTGNGQPSLITRVSVLESNISFIRERVEQYRGFWFWLTPLTLTFIATGAAVYSILQ